MADGVVQLHDDGPGKKVDAALLTVGGQSVYRQRVEIHSDATTPPSVKITDGAGTVNTKQLGTQLSGSIASQAPNAALRVLGVGIDNTMSELIIGYTPLTTNQSVSGYMQALEY